MGIYYEIFLMGISNQLLIILRYNDGDLPSGKPTKSY